MGRLVYGRYSVYTICTCTWVGDRTILPTETREVNCAGPARYQSRFASGRQSGASIPCPGRNVHGGVGRVAMDETCITTCSALKKTASGVVGSREDSWVCSQSPASQSFLTLRATLQCTRSFYLIPKRSSAKEPAPSSLLQHCM